MVISIMGILLYAKVSLLYNVLWEWLCCCLQVNYIVYKHFDRLVHIVSLISACLQNFRPLTLTVFEILGFKLKNKDDKKNWKNRLFTISPIFVLQFSPTFM